MTLWDFLDSVKRGWVVLLLGLTLTSGWVVLLGNVDGVYQSQMRLVFALPPGQQTGKNSITIGPTNNRLISFAIVVATKIDGGHSMRHATSPDVALVDEGIYDGWAVYVPDYGGQWASNMTEPTLILQATGPTPTAVSATMVGLIDQVEREMDTLQADVAPQSRISYVASPASITVQYVQGRSTMARLVAAVLGVSLSLVAALLSAHLREKFLATRSR